MSEEIQFNQAEARPKGDIYQNSRKENGETLACLQMSAELRRDTTSPSADSSKSNTSAQEEPGLKPFPTDTFSEEILHLILYHVLTEPDFGKNGKWASREEAKQDKIKFALAHKVSTVSECQRGYLG